MLIEFRVGNFRSFHDDTVLSMVAAKRKARNSEVDSNNVIEVDERLTLLRSCLVFGANASGKSNLVRAMETMRRMVLDSARGQQGDKLPIQPFRLDTTSSAEPSAFQVLFLHDGHRYRYGFEATADRIVSEWLYHTPNRRETKLFERDGDEIALSRKFREGRDLQDKTRTNALFVSVCAQFNGEISSKVLAFFKTLKPLHGSLIDLQAGGFTAEQLRRNTHLAAPIRHLVAALDLGIQQIDVQEAPLTEEQRRFHDGLMAALGRPEMGDDPKAVTVKTIHSVRDAQGTAVDTCEFLLADDESEGTRNLFAMAGPILDTLLNGWTLVVDELDAQLHPLMVKALTDLFHDPQTNKRGAQLVMMTHNVTLLDKERFRRDQVWLVEKDRREQSTLYSLVEFKGVRNDAALDRNYLAKKFGAVPYIDSLVPSIREALEFAANQSNATQRQHPQGPEGSLS